MKATKIRELLKESEEARTWHWQELTELERLAEIGRATEINKIEIIEFLYNKDSEMNAFHYSDGGNQYRQGYKQCLKDIIKFVEGKEEKEED